MAAFDAADAKTAAVAAASTRSVEEVAVTQEQPGMARDVMGDLEACKSRQIQLQQRRSPFANLNYTSSPSPTLALPLSSHSPATKAFDQDQNMRHVKRSFWKELGAAIKYELGKCALCTKCATTNNKSIDCSDACDFCLHHR